MDPEFEKVLERFDPVPPETLSDDDRARIAAVRELHKLVVKGLHEALPAGRYKALALTALEESATWAVRAVTHR